MEINIIMQYKIALGIVLSKIKESEKNE